MLNRDISQIKIAEQVKNYFDRGIKNIIISAPTGYGKTGIAWFIHEVLNMPTTVLSHQKILQDQYDALLNNQKGFLTIKGKENYKCRLNSAITVKSARCGINIPCVYKNFSGCEYFDKFKQLKDAEFLNVNYQQFFNLDVMAQNRVLIFDECHNIYNICTSIFSSEINEKTLKTFVAYKDFIEHRIEMEQRHIRGINDIVNVLSEIRDFSKEYSDRSEFGDICFNGLNVVLTSFIKSLSSFVGSNEEALKDDKTIDIYSKILNDCKDLNLSIKKAYYTDLNKFNKKSDTVYETSYTNNKKFSVRIIPLEIKDKIKNYFRHADVRIFMSSTIFEKQKMLENLGISDSYEFIDLDSKFKVENRKVFVVPLKNINYSVTSKQQKERKAELSSYYDAIKNTVFYHANLKENGIIFTPSYSFANILLEDIGKDLEKYVEIFYNSCSQERDYVLNEFKTKKSKLPKLLISPSFFEGVNFENSLSNYQIISKVPYGNINSNFIKYRLKNYPNEYKLDAMKCIVQACGRSVRNENDHAMTYIFDKEFMTLYESTKNFIPEWYKKALDFSVLN